MDDKTTAGLIHLLNIFGLGIVSIILWAVKKDESQFVDAHGKAFLNYFITLSIAFIVGFILSFILIGFLVLAAIGVYALVFGIIATMKAFNEEMYTYPLTIQFIK